MPGTATDEPGAIAPGCRSPQWQEAGVQDETGARCRRERDAAQAGALPRSAAAVETERSRMSARLWSLGILLVALGLAAREVGWDTLLWLPMATIRALLWIPAAAIDAVRSDPATYGVVALGVALMVLARVIGRRGG